MNLLTKNWPIIPLVAVVCMAAFTAFFSPAYALCLGMIISVAVGNPLAKFFSKYSKVLLQFSVVLLGLKFDLIPVLRVGAEGFAFALFTILLTFAIAIGLSKVLNVREGITTLIAAGTAICGGSAIAAVSAVLKSDDDDVAISIGTIFLLNAAALFTFPPLGRAMGMTPESFGVWAGIAIHDISSVAGAAASFGQNADAMAMPVKLSRALWIAPMALTLGYLAHRKSDGETTSKKKFTFPWFILAFFGASALATFAPAVREFKASASLIAAVGFSTTLFMIGMGLSRDSLKKVGTRPLLLAIALWAFISGATFIYLKVGGRA